jgi:hypothetical protein
MPRALKPFPLDPLIPPATQPAVVMDVVIDCAIGRADLGALVAMLQHEHFTYDGDGAAAKRALTGLTAALETAATFLAITDEGGR